MFCSQHNTNLDKYTGLLVAPVLQNLEDTFKQFKAKSGSKYNIIQSTVHGSNTSLCIPQKVVPVCKLVKYTGVGVRRMKTTF